MRLPITIDIDPPTLLRALATQIEAAPAPAQVAAPAAAIGSKPIPAFGAFLEEQGGIFSGIYLDDAGQLRGIVTPVDDHGELGDMACGPRDKEIQGASSKTDGLANTNAMAEAGSKMAAAARAARIGGFDDWCIPAQSQLMACFLFHPDQFAKVWHWSSTQSSAFNAWGQYFENGTVYIITKDSELRCRLVRSFPFSL